ncbi:MAG: hypothetical protein R3C68_08195 [Myxococcota bacterium]
MRKALMALAAVGAFSGGALLWHIYDGSGHDEVASQEPMVIKELGAEVFFLRAPQIVRRGADRVMVVRFNRPEFVPYHFEHEGSDGPKTIDDWAVYLGAPVVLTPVSSTRILRI